MPLQPLTTRDAAVVQHIQRYNLSIPEVILRRVLSGISFNALKKVLQRLVRKKWLRRYPLYQQRMYYVLSRSACRHMQVCDRHAQAMGHEALIQHYGVLRFCERLQVQKLMSAEFLQFFPELHRPGLPSTAYFLDPASEKLGWIIVDHGARPERIASKVGRVIGKRYVIDAFGRLIQQGRFVIAIVTATERKRLAVAAKIEQRPPRHVPVSVVAIEDLQPLLIGAK